MTKMAETLDAVTSSAADVYVNATKLSKTKVMELLAAETWMTPKEAVKNGFASQVGNGKAAKMTNEFDLHLSMFKNVPEELKVVLPEPEPEPVPVVAGIDLATTAEPTIVLIPVAEPEPDPLINIFRKKLEMLRA
jgi:hypothetical protein